jgi:hypothetical protein|tara:strand:+ start:328 stop:612 length:285 start_codon:yes stop_codon:yes gene_type:complete
MARYPDLPTLYNISTEEMNNTYNELKSWSGTLINELETRDAQVNDTPSTNIYSVVTVTTIGRPKAGDIAYSSGEGKFKGYVSITGTPAAWVDFN